MRRRPVEIEDWHSEFVRNFTHPEVSREGALRRRKWWLCVAAVFVVLCPQVPLSAQSAELSCSSGSGIAVSDVTIAVSVTSIGGDIDGVSGGVQHTPELELGSAPVLGSAFDPITGVGSPDFVFLELAATAGGAAGFTFGFVVDFNLTISLPTGVSQELTVATYSIPAGTAEGVYPLNFTDALIPLNPPTSIAIINQVSLGPIEVAPTLDHGSIEVVSSVGVFLRGDTNADLTVDLADAVASLSFLFEGGPSVCLDAIDANDDGILDISDPIKVLVLLFSLGPPLPAPYRAPGLDPTADALSCL